MQTLQIVILVLVAFGIIFVRRLRQKLAMLAEQIRGLREHAVAHVTYRPVGNVEVADALHETTQEAEKLGFVMLGDYVEEAKLNPTERPMRWFVDPAGTTFGWMAPFVVDGERHVVLVLMSHELDAQVITSRQPLSSTLSRPSFVTLQHVPPATSVAATFTKHRTKSSLEDPERAYIPVHTFDEVVHELDRMREKVITWRKAQPEAELLDADLKCLLGPQYAKLAGPLRRRLV